MNNILGVREILAFLEKLRAILQDFKAREEKLGNDFRARSAAEARAFQTAEEEHALQHSIGLANLEAVFHSEKKRRLSRFERRKVKINEAHKLVRRGAMEKITEHEGRAKHRLQENAIEAERRRDADRAGATANLAEFKDRLTENVQEFGVLERTAQKAFRGYGKFRKLLGAGQKWPEPDLARDENQLLEELVQLQARSRAGLDNFRKMPLPLVFKYFPFWLVIVLLVGSAAAIPLRDRLGIDANRYRVWIISAGVLSALLMVLHFFGRKSAGPAALAIAGDLARARRLHDACFDKAELRHQQEQERIQKQFENTTREMDQEWKRILKEAIEKRDLRPREIDEQAVGVSRKNEELHRARLARFDREHAEKTARLGQESEDQAQHLAANKRATQTKREQEQQVQWQALEQEWNASVKPICSAISEANDSAEQLFPEWDTPAKWEKWTPPDKFKNAVKFGRLEVDLEQLAGGVPTDPRLTLPCPTKFSLPLVLTYPREGSILFETTRTGNEEVIGGINNIIFRLLSTTPPGKLSFTIFDPQGLGQNFAGIMHLADYEESHINSRIWTQAAQFEEKLAELNEHMEKVIQMYLRNEYETIAEYNAQAGIIAEKYHILVIASFPVNFTDTAARRLLNIATSGARCGVYTLIHWDQRHPLPQDFVPDELKKNSTDIVRTEKRFELANRQMQGLRLLLDAPPSPEFVTHFLHQVGQSSKDSNRVEVPFEQVAPPNSEIWKEQTTEELRVPIGRSGATKFQYLAIGKGTRQHALIAGKTGSGKSTLFHIIITNLALWCDPEQVEFYLVDFKKGVEFKCYASRRLPHARVVAIESDRQFGLSVLQRVDIELRRRGDLFRKMGVQDVAGYKRAGGTEAIPRSLLMIDEFQEFFVEEDRISQDAAVLLDRIVRQGRAFGIHVVLGSQTLGGAYTLARATIGQMVIRIALQCNEADAYLIMDQDNPAPRLLSRPGEGIYNDSAGSIEGNSPFQAVWLPDDVRDAYLAKVRERADQSPKPYPGPFVFEGNAPADVRENEVLAALLRTDSVQPPASPRIWLGAPNSIKGPTEAILPKQSGSNLLIVGQNEEASLVMVAMSMLSVAAQFTPAEARFILLESIPTGSTQRAFLDRVIGAIPHEIVQARNSELTDIMRGLSEDLKERGEDKKIAEKPLTFLLIHGLQNYKKLRQEDEFSFSGGGSETAAQPAAVLLNLINEGPSQGIHVVITCDTYNNVTRFLGRKTLSEFAMRVLFQMSASDSASLIDTPEAGTLGLHRAVLYNDREGYLETFRPYALPDNEWLEGVARNLKRLLPQPAS